MDCSHDSSRCHAAMFFSQAFPFQVILHRFDKHDGLRRLFNVVRTCHSFCQELVCKITQIFNKIIKMSSFKSENIQKKEVGSDRSVSNN